MHHTATNNQHSCFSSHNKSKGKTGCQIVFPSAHMPKKHCETLQSASTDFMGNSLHCFQIVRHKLLVEVVYLLTHIPLFFMSLLTITYKPEIIIHPIVSWLHIWYFKSKMTTFFPAQCQVKPASGHGIKYPWQLNATRVNWNRNDPGSLHLITLTPHSRVDASTPLQSAEAPGVQLFVFSSPQSHQGARSLPQMAECHTHEPNNHLHRAGPRQFSLYGT